MMNSYADVDGVPAAADRGLLTGVLRDEWGFTGTVVSDYWAIAFLQTMHRIAGDAGRGGRAGAGGRPGRRAARHRCFGEPLPDWCAPATVPRSSSTAPCVGCSRQKVELGLLDADWKPSSCRRGRVDLDPPEQPRARPRVAEESITWSANDGDLPLAPARRVALIGPCADDPRAFLGCYSFPNHVLPRHPSCRSGSRSRPCSRRCARAARYRVTHAPGCHVRTPTGRHRGRGRGAPARPTCASRVVGDLAGPVRPRHLG